mgnify:FL=1
MGYRKQPFGYRMQLGEIVIDEAEALLVQEIFKRYTAGESLGKLTEALRQQDVPYDEDRIWNKNMVARILADQRYTGIEEYPKIIEPDQLSIANKKRAKMSCSSRKTEAQKVLRRLCGGSPPEWVEREVAELLNTLMRNPGRICATAQPHTAGSKTQKKLEEALRQQPVVEECAQTLVFQQAMEQYADIGNQEYETERLRRLFAGFQCSPQLDAALLKSAVSSAVVTAESVKLRLKNGQIIERSDQQCKTMRQE